MNRLLTTLERACKELELSIVAPFSLKISNIELRAVALLPQLGGPKGMIILGNNNEYPDFGVEILKLGYSYSTLDEPLSGEIFDLEVYIEMFSDWGWGWAEASKPAWMI